MAHAKKPLSVTSSQTEKLEVAEKKMYRWAYGFMRMDYMRNDNIMDKIEIEATVTKF